MSAGLQACALCRGDGCAACDNAGFFRTVAAWLRPAPRAKVAVTMPAAGWLLTVARDGTAVAGRGESEEWTFARWAVSLSADGKAPAKRYRNGGPVSIVKVVTGKRPPEWAARVCAWAAARGGVTEGEATAAAEWYRCNRRGEFPGVRA